MSKKLISVNNIQEYLCGDKFYVEKGMILSSGAKDYCKERNITIVYGTKCETKEIKSVEKPVETLKEMVVRVLKNDFNIVDERLAEIIVRKCEGVRN